MSSQEHAKEGRARDAHNICLRKLHVQTSEQIYLYGPSIQSKW